MEIIITLIIVSIISYTSFRFLKYRKRLKAKIKLGFNKITSINDNILTEIETKKDKDYYPILQNKYPNRIDIMDRLSKKVSNSNLETINKDLIKMDSFYVDLKKSIRLLDSFEDFKQCFSNKKRKYRTTFNKSMKIINLLNDKYGNVVDKYLINFNKDYDIYKENEITILNNKIKEATELYKNLNVNELDILFSEIVKLDNEITIKLEEPQRLRDKFVKSEDNIDQMEINLENKKGSLYYKVFNYIKNNKVSKKDTEEWNKIKRHINTYKKNKIIKPDIIELGNKLNEIINDMSELNYKFRKEVIEEKVN
jgi:hypothetical protein